MSYRKPNDKYSPRASRATREAGAETGTACCESAVILTELPPESSPVSDQLSEE